jgi:NADPH:quinone reductase-like Zn-dependent oxidoreductase
MKCIEVVDKFGLDQLRLSERETKEPGPGEIRVALKAASLNYRDLLMVQGQYNPKQPLPLIPGSDGVGVVETAGSTFKVGDRVATCFAPDWIAGEPTRAKIRQTLGGPRDGTFATHITLPESAFVHVPTHLSDEEAATLPCAGVTAWNALVTLGQIKAGDSVLIQGTGGVSLFALQFAVMHGARAIVTSSSDEKLERCKAMGAAATINYKKTPEWGKAAKQLAGGDGVDLVMEVGGAGTLNESLKAVRIGGSIMLIGVLSGTQTPLSLTAVMMQAVRVQGLVVGNREMFEAMNRAITAHKMTPHVDKVFALAETRAAFEYLAQQKHFGKVALALG